MFRKLAVFTFVALVILLRLTGAGHYVETQSNGGMPSCWAKNNSYTTTCAEYDNVNVPIFGPQVSRFLVMATHPTYSFTYDGCPEDWSGCSSSSGDAGQASDVCTKIYDDHANNAIWVCTVTSWWRPYSMNVMVDGHAASAHYLQWYRRIPGTSSWPQFLVLYEDGNLRLKPHPARRNPKMSASAAPSLSALHPWTQTRSRDRMWTSKRFRSTQLHYLSTSFTGTE
jgi:hypothetical protein